jgi:hypothetical protein
MTERDQIAVRRAELRTVVIVLVGWALLMVVIVTGAVALRGVWS